MFIEKRHNPSNKAPEGRHVICLNRGLTRINGLRGEDCLKQDLPD